MGPSLPGPKALRSKCVHLIVRRHENAAVSDDGWHEFLHGQHGVRGGAASINAGARVSIEAVQLVVGTHDPHDGVLTLCIGHADRGRGIGRETGAPGECCGRWRCCVDLDRGQRLAVIAIRATGAATGVTFEYHECAASRRVRSWRIDNLVRRYSSPGGCGRDATEVSSIDQVSFAVFSEAHNET